MISTARTAAKCGVGEGKSKTVAGECPKGGKHIYKFAKCTKCGAAEGKPSVVSVLDSKSELLFHHMDADGDGRLSEVEIRTVAEATGCNPDSFWSILKKYDADGDEHITRDEV
jgi:hypothetical protein